MTTVVAYDYQNHVFLGLTRSKEREVKLYILVMTEYLF